MGGTARGKKKATKVAAPAAAAPADGPKSGPQRTPQNPFEHTEETLYAVDKIINLRWARGNRQYLVRWEGYGESHDTWEPMENLVGCATQIRQYEQQRVQEDAAEKEKLVAKRQKLKDDAAAEQAALKARAAEAAAAAAGDGAAAGAENVDAAGEAILKRHQSKRGAVWEAYDLSGERPACKLFKPNGKDVCGAMPSAMAGTSNFWSHLWSHHRQKWYELKQKDGQLNAAGAAELVALKAAFTKMETEGAARLSDGRGSEFLSAKLPATEKATMDRITAEWVVDEDHAFNAASTVGFRRMMATATNGKYDGCCNKTVEHHVMAMGMEGKAECSEFHRELLAGGVKPAASGDLWSKNGTALFGLVSHGIRRVETPQPDGPPAVKWEMCEKLAGAVPCSAHRHTGEHIGELSDEAWAATGLKKPVQEIFVRVSDNGSNMIKGWQEGFQAPCADHTEELSVNLFTTHLEIASTFEKGRGMVGYFNSSVVGYSEESHGLHACQKMSNLPVKRLIQDVKTRWRSTHAMAEALRCNQVRVRVRRVRVRVRVPTPPP